jgi:protein TonB
VYVSAAGRAEKVEFRKRSDSPLLDEAALGLANSLRYNPAQLDGKPVADWIDLPVVFKLRKP